MRIGRLWTRGSALALLPPAVLLAAGPAQAQVPQIFPVKPGLVPFVVAAAFILPAIVAGALSMLRRAGRSLGPVLGLALLVAAAALVAYVNPGVMAQLRI